MAKRKKNAGKGFGMMFHGAFGSKEAAKKKERQVHGFIQPRNIKGARRFVVMSERKNPIKRKKRKAATTERNPSELVVLGANPGSGSAPQEIVLEPGKKYLIRTNPSAEGLRETWTGTPAEGWTVYDVEGMDKGDYAQLGELLALYVKPVIGGQVREIHFKRPRPLLVSDTTARQLYFVNGNQDSDPRISENLYLFNSAVPSTGMVELGEVRRIDYKQRKEHVPEPDIDEWKHNFGEESGVRPTLWFDVGLRRLFLKGGEYTVRREGLVN